MCKFYFDYCKYLFYFILGYCKYFNYIWSLIWF
jgi:hypothetical protein